jgi:selenocysteine lyase/cysteine desulfurase
VVVDNTYRMNNDDAEKNPYIRSRRNAMALLGMIPFTSVLADNFSKHTMEPVKNQPYNKGLAEEGMFSIKGTYLNAAYTHPMSTGSAEAIKNYLDFRMVNGKSQQSIDKGRDAVRTLFATLINADPDEISWIPSTMVGENLIVSGLGLPGTKSRIVTDAYHFDGSLYLYGELGKQGADVKIILPKNNRIDPADIDAAITSGTKLVAVSLVSMINGFEHDLKELCTIAHARGALVYADIIQAAGTVPVDVHASGVDFCACATYKWLMGDFGAGFLYVRKDRLDLLKRSQYGYRQLTDMHSHVFPFDGPASVPFDWTVGTHARNYFEVGTLGNAAVPALHFSLNYLLKTGVDRIQAYRKPMIDRLQASLPALGYVPMTPEKSTSPIVTFAFREAEKILPAKLAAAGINIQVYENRFRISPSVYNTMDDIDLLINVLS